MNSVHIVLSLFLITSSQFVCLASASKKKDDGCNEVGCFPPKSTIPRVNIIDSCKKIYVFDTALSVTASKYDWLPIPPCLSCDLKLSTTQTESTITAVFYSLGTRASPSCQETRLDIFDGLKPSDATLLSNKSGICGSVLPHQTFQTSSNTLTIRLTTSCAQIPPRFGTFDIIVGVTKKVKTCEGQFKCLTGECIDKALVCDGFYQCPDHSDETDCQGRHGHPVPAWLMAIFIIIAVALFVLFLVTMLMVCLKYLCNSGYTRV